MPDDSDDVRLCFVWADSGGIALSSDGRRSAPQPSQVRQEPACLVGFCVLGWTVEREAPRAAQRMLPRFCGDSAATAVLLYHVLTAVALQVPQDVDPSVLHRGRRAICNDLGGLLLVGGGTFGGFYEQVRNDYGENMRFTMARYEHGLAKDVMSGGCESVSYTHLTLPTKA